MFVSKCLSHSLWSKKGGQSIGEKRASFTTWMNDLLISDVESYGFMTIFHQGTIYSWRLIMHCFYVAFIALIPEATLDSLNRSTMLMKSETHEHMNRTNTTVYDDFSESHWRQTFSTQLSSVWE